MKVYVLIADERDSYGVTTNLFGVFSTEEKADKRANELELDYYNIYPMEIDENEVPSYYLARRFE